MTDCTDTKITLHWKRPPGTGAIEMYRVCVNDSLLLVETPNTTAEITGLASYTAYEVQVAARNQDFWGEMTEKFQVRTKPGIPHKPKNLRATDATSHSLTFEWEEPVPSTGKIKHYLTSFSVENVSETKTTVGRSMFFEGLSPLTIYSMGVAAVTSAGVGPYIYVSKKTLLRAPGPPELKVEITQNTSLTVSWNRSKFYVAPYPSNCLRWRVAGYSYTTKEFDNITKGYTITELTPFTTYMVQIRSFNGGNYGLWSKELCTKTENRVPNPAIIQEIHLLEGRSVQVTWTTSGDYPGPLNYTLKAWNVPRPFSDCFNKYQPNWITGTISREEWIGSHSDVVTNLIPFQKYSFEILLFTSATNEGIRSEKSKEIQIPPEAAGEPTLVTANCSFSPTEASVSWRPPQEPNGIIYSYIVEYRLENGHYWHFSAEIPVDNMCEDQSLLLRGLKPGQPYDIRVYARVKGVHGNGRAARPKRGCILPAGVPSVPLNFAMESYPMDTVVKLIWNHPLHPNAPNIKYNVMWNTSTEEFKSNYTENMFPGKRIVVQAIYNLKPYTNYSARVSAITAAGQGPWTTFISFQTAAGVPNKPTNLKVTSVSAYSLTLSWEEPVPSTGPIELYTVQWCEEDGVKKDYTSTYDGSFVLEGLSPFRIYSVQVHARTSAGIGPSADIRVKTSLGVPDPPELKVEEFESTSISVSWTPSKNYRGPRPDYHLRWRSKRDSYVIEHPYYGVTRWVIKWLAPYTVYEVQIRGRNDAGVGNWSTEQDIQTKVGVPLPAVFLEILPLEGRGVQIDWTTKGYYPGPLSYSLQVWKIPGPCSTLSREYQANVISGTKSREEWSERNSDIVTDLSPFGKYQVEIIFFTSATGVVTSKSKVIQIAPEAAEEPMNLTADCSFSPTKARVSWKPPNEFTGIISSYVVEYATENVSFSNEIPVSNMCEEKNLVLSGLTPKRSYNISVFARVHGLELDGKVARLKEECILPAAAEDFPKMAVSLGTIVSAAVLLLLGIVVIVGCGIRRKFYLDAIEQPGGCTNQSLAVSELQMEECSSSWQSRRCSSHSLTVSQQDMDQNSSSRVIKCKEFDHHIRSMMSDHHLKFSEEFEMLKNESPNLPCTVAEMDINSSKNRWKDLLPFDHSRVKLLPLCDVPGSDYINASYIPGFSSRREYIGCQGPLPNTVDDFWRMIWEHSVSMVVMLTQCMERDVKAYKQKCEQYWPDFGQSNHYSDLCVTCVLESIHSSYTIREFHVQMDSYERQVKQMHFTHWPDFGSPECPEDLINFVKAVRHNLPREEAGPILVHCSAGVGRTGTYIVVDRLSQQLQIVPAFPENDAVNIYATVLELRNHRTNIVQTEDQYIYVYLCVNQLIQERREFPVEECGELA